MNREIKLRQWNKEVGDFDYVAINSGSDSTILKGNNWQIFSGFKDKNGKDIYEGDLLSYNGDGTITESFDEEVVYYDEGLTERLTTDSSVFVEGNVFTRSEVIGHNNK